MEASWKPPFSESPVTHTLSWVILGSPRNLSVLKGTLTPRWLKPGLRVGFCPLPASPEVAAKEKSGIRFLPTRIIFNGLKRGPYKKQQHTRCFQSSGEFQGSPPPLSLWPAVPETPAETDGVKAEEPLLPVWLEVCSQPLRKMLQISGMGSWGGMVHSGPLEN